MKKRILPETIDNQYKGKPLAYWAFILITLVTIARSLVHIFAPDGGAETTATIPLGRFGVEGAQTVILMFGYWGISQLLLGILYLIAALKYRSLIPLMYLILCAEYVLRLGVGWAKPIITESTAPGAIGNYVMIPLSIVMFIFSMQTKEKDEAS